MIAIDNMIKSRKFSIVLIAAIFCACTHADENPYSPEVGDIYFQSLPASPLVVTIEGVTGSPYSHCGVLNKVDGEWVVHEAIGPVRVTRLDDWINQGKRGEYDVFRLDDKYRSRIDEFIVATESYMGKPYDIQYDFDDEKIYCSELLFKAFRTVFKEELGEVVALGDLDWKPYEAIIRSIDPSLPLERMMITPRHLSEAEQLEVVFQSLN